MEEEEAAAAAVAVSLAPLDWSQPNSQEEDAPEGLPRPKAWISRKPNSQVSHS
jgi:hypothetical protein